jgi:hypothetical protein
VPYRGKTRTYELFEAYEKGRALTMEDNDTSFMVAAALPNVDAVDTYRFTSEVAQYVTVVVVPENGQSDFDVEVRGSGRSIALSDVEGHQEPSSLGYFTEGTFVDFVQFRAEAGERLEALVHARQVTPNTPKYRLIVVGATPYLPNPDVRGPHQLAAPRRR